MKKLRKLLLIIVLILLIITGYLSFYYLIRIPKAIATDSWVFKFPDKYEEYTTIKCNLFDITDPEFAFVGILTVYGTRSYEVDFYSTKTSNLFSKEIIPEYTGGTTIKNTTFPQLVEMVKEDCSQFQESYYDESELGDMTGMTEEEKTERWHETELKNVNWTYYKNYAAEDEEEELEDTGYDWRDNYTEEDFEEARRLLKELQEE